jgi:hypothetical protein
MRSPQVRHRSVQLRHRPGDYDKAGCTVTACCPLLRFLEGLTPPMSPLNFAAGFDKGESHSLVVK